MMDVFFTRITYVFDPLHAFYEREKFHQKVSVLMVVVFIGALLAIELKRQGLLPAVFSTLVPGNHFYAVEIAFTFILILEIISLIFVLPCSFSKSLGKQFEILALILIRNAFKELSYFPEPISYIGNEENIMYIVSDGFGALLIFALLGAYYRFQVRGEEDTRARDLYGFVATKKAISLLLLVLFIGMGCYSVLQALGGLEKMNFFYDFYTVLILTDILIVLLSQCFNPSSVLVFRNSGYALSTLMIRFALVAPVFFNVLLGTAAIVFAISLNLTLGYLYDRKGLSDH